MSTTVPRANPLPLPRPHPPPHPPPHPGSAGDCPPPGRPTARRSTSAGPWVSAGVAAAGCLYVGLNDPSGGGAFVPCPFHAVTGLWCPGCGMTRAVHHLVTGDLPAALSSNLLLPVVLAVAVWGWLAWVRPSFPRIGTTLPTWVWPALAAVAVVFGVLRNLPVDALQTLAP